MSLRRADALTEHVAAAAALWHDTPAVRVHQWDADTVVYVQDSAATHWLDSDAARAFLALRSSAQPLTVHGLAVALNLCGADEEAELEALLLQLRSLGLAASESSAPR